MGRPEAALEPIDEAVRIRRANHDAFLPDLATTLDNLSPLGAETETSAVAVGEEIARIFALGEVREDLILAALG